MNRHNLSEVDTHYSGTMTLGGLIRQLEPLPADLRVHFDFCHLAPGSVDSWRGIYEHLALGHGTEPTTVGVLLGKLRSADQRSFMGYKGGHYRMHLGTPVWVDNYGEYTNTQIVGIESDEFEAVLVTKRESDA